MACLCKRPPPFLARLLQEPMGAYSREYGIITVKSEHTRNGVTDACIHDT